MIEGGEIPSLPKEGDAFAVPLGSGRYSVCRVILDHSNETGQWHGGAILVAGSDWVGDEVPLPDEPALRSILHLTHHSWNNSLNIIWVADEPPDDFILIGTIRPSLEE